MKWLTAIVALLVVAGCGPEAPDPTAPVDDSVPLVGADSDPSRTPTRIEIDGLPSVSMAGIFYLVGLEAFDNLSDTLGSFVPRVPVEWSSSDTAVATFESATSTWPAAGVLRLVGGGTTTVTARAAGLSATAELTAVSGAAVSDAAASAALVVDSFTVVEFTYPGHDPDHWFYAPRLAVRDTTGTPAVVFAFQLVLPGLGDTPQCASVRPVAASASAQVFQETYGDYDITFDRPGQRTTAGSASAVVYVMAADGTVGSLRQLVPVVSGGLPETITGGTLVPWSCGYPVQ